MTGLRGFNFADQLFNFWMFAEFVLISFIKSDVRKTYNINVICHVFAVAGTPRNFAIKHSQTNPASEIVIEWTSPEGGDALEGYLISWKHSIWNSFIVTHISGKKTYRHKLTNLSPITTYEVKILVQNEAGLGSGTSSKSITTSKFVLFLMLF